MGRAAALAAAQGAQVAEPGLEKPGSGTEGPIKVAMGQRGLSKWLWDRGANQSGYGTEGPIKVAMGQRGQSKWLWDRGVNQSGYGTEGPIKVAMGQRGLSKWLWDRGANQSGYGPSICVLCCHMGLVSGVVDRISKQPKNDLSALG